MGNRLIRIAVVVFKGQQNADPSTATVFLEGGPSAAVQYSLSLFTREYIDALGAGGDVIVLDQRGVGYSEPRLDCTSRPASCARYWRNQGVNLASYNTEENAKDVNDVRGALGYQKLNLYGISYGTLLAQLIMRDFPNQIRAVVIDGVLPNSVNPVIDNIRTKDLAIQAAIKTCAEQPACNAAYPNLETRLKALLERLSRFPVAREIDDTELLNTFVTMLYDDERLKKIPALIESLERRQVDVYNSIFSSGVEFDFEIPDSDAMYFAVVCRDMMSLSNLSELNAIVQAPTAVYARGLSVYVPGYFDNCNAFNTETAPATWRQPIRSDAPTLLISGRFDPVTPPEYAAKVAQNFSNAKLLEFSAGGHGNAASEARYDCGIGLMRTFMRDPNATLDTACAATPVAFDLPRASAP
jgi:pimeloyl-ACP methyl ester carboxylesterase